MFVQQIVLALVVRQTCQQTDSSVQVLAQQELKLARLQVEVVAALAEGAAEAGCIARGLKRFFRRD